jgi:uncharacterized protein YbjT (DUF2867 family)
MRIAVVIDASNGPPSRQARAVLVDGSRRLLEVERRVGVGHHACVSIVGIDAVPMAYYRVKVEQEQVVEGGGVPWTIVRCTQFHDLLGGLLAAAGRRAIEIPIPLPGKLGRALREGRLTCASPEVRGTRTFAEWLQSPRSVASDTAQ